MEIEIKLHPRIEIKDSLDTHVMRTNAGSTKVKRRELKSHKTMQFGKHDGKHYTKKFKTANNS
jgi:hypothetical protein